MKKYRYVVRFSKLLSLDYRHGLWISQMPFSPNSSLVTLIHLYIYTHTLLDSMVKFHENQIRNSLTKILQTDKRLNWQTYLYNFWFGKFIRFLECKIMIFFNDVICCTSNIIIKILPICASTAWKRLMSNGVTRVIAKPLRPTNTKYIYIQLIINQHVPSVLWHCWLGGRKSIWPIKTWVMRYWHGYLSGARCKWLAYGPTNTTATPSTLLHTLTGKKSH